MFAIYETATGEVKSINQTGNAPSGCASYDIGGDQIDVKTTYFPGGVKTTRAAVVTDTDRDILRAKIRKQVSRRITAVASTNTQANLLAAKVTGELSATDALVYHTWADWTKATRMVGKSLAESLDETYADDSHWPAPSAALVALAAEY